jgi:type IV pilus assembly protein PilA
MQSTKMSRLLRVAREAAARRNTESDEVGTESGFTLIELMVVLLIMAILLAIAIPTFLGVKGGAQDRSAQSDLANALLTAKTAYTNNGSYTTVAASLVTILQSQEPELTFGVATATAPHQIEVAVAADGNAIILVDSSQSGNCWAVDDNDGSAAEAAAFGNAPQGNQYLGWNSTVHACSAAYALTAVAGDWHTSFPASLTTTASL